MRARTSTENYGPRSDNPILPSQYLCELVLAGGHVGAPCLKLCEHYRRVYMPGMYDVDNDMDYDALFVTSYGIRNPQN